MSEGMTRSAQGKRPHFYETPALDQMMSMIMVLAGEVSVLADHIDSIERVAAANGLDLRAGIASLALDQVALEEREARRQALLGRLFYLMRKEAAEAEAAETAEGYAAVIDEIAVG
ncbi:hypothetical protein [Glacieibacterium frigidum]|uniref:Uncharacterized protein n=1 Tax=Glacieibacterium frigidum TaxID=2593303 RepID=A0A552U876_9SPHN|nr:hypothetical protein [Glacieibacterium frigidum]TRW14426.1 hypothetical protein FMM06_12010 [Glacieibacterium frigidum]